jgi:hypothetical protein
MACGTSLCILARDSGRSCARLRPWGRGARGRWGSPGSPSIWVTSPSFTKTRWPQPTAQYGQMDLTTSSASDVRGLRCAWRADCAALPSARGSSPPSWRTTDHAGIRSRMPISRHLSYRVGLQFALVSALGPQSMSGAPRHRMIDQGRRLVVR